MTFFDEIKTIAIPIEDFGVYEESDDVTHAVDYYINEVYELAKKYNITVEAHWGASQLAFVVEETKEVYKTPFLGQMEQWNDKEWDDEDYEEGWQENFEYFRRNYTALTEEIYHKAEDAGVAMFFAKIKKIGNNLWIQEYVEPRAIQKASKTYSDDSLKKAKAMDRVPFEDDWIAVAIDMYGEEKFQSLLKFIKDEELSDFHWNNYGWDQTGAPKLLDYCGYYG